MHDKAFTFQTLRPDTIIDGLFDLGMRVDSGLTPLNSYENRVYQFQDEERHRYVVKFYRPERWSAEQILEEHQFALQLVEDEVPVAAPLLFNDSTLHQHQGFYFAVFPSLGGRQFEADNLDQMEWVGATWAPAPDWPQTALYCPPGNWRAGVSAGTASGV